MPTCGERDARRDDALNGGVVGQVEEEHGAVHGSVLLKVLLEEVRRLHVDTHGRKHNGKLVGLALGTLLAHQSCSGVAGRGDDQQGCQPGCRWGGLGGAS